MSEQIKPRLTQKQRFLRYMMDHHREWILNDDLVRMFGSSYNQRKNELHRDEGIIFEPKNVRNDDPTDDHDRIWYYRLLTDPWLIDPIRCTLRTTMASHPLSLGDEAPPSKKPVQRRQGEDNDYQTALNF